MESTYETNIAHKHIIDFLCEIDDVCREHGIKYSLHGGTLLGAERNGRLIPWDDDADISMLRSQFNKLKMIENELPFRIEKGESAPWLTEFSRRNDDKSKTSIDVFIWDYISESKTKQSIKINAIRLLQGMMKKEIDYTTYTPVQKCFVFVSHILGIPFSQNFKRLLYNKVSCNFLTGKKQFIHRSNDAYVGVSYVFDCGYMNSYTRLKLEGHDFMVAKRYKEFLVRNYGENYLIPPDEAARKVVHGHNKAFLPESERGGLFSIRR